MAVVVSVAIAAFRLEVKGRNVQERLHAPRSRRQTQGKLDNTAKLDCIAAKVGNFSQLARNRPGFVGGTWPNSQARHHASGKGGEDSSGFVCRSYLQPPMRQAKHAGDSKVSQFMKMSFYEGLLGQAIDYGVFEICTAMETVHPMLSRNSTQFTGANTINLLYSVRRGVHVQ